MARIETGRILWGVSYQLAPAGTQCVARWFTEFSEASARKAMLDRLAEPEDNPVYQQVRRMCVRLPDAFTPDELQKLTPLI